MSVYKRGDSYWYRFMFRGIQIHKSSKSKTKGVAERLEREHRRKLELNQQDLKPLEKPKQFSVAADEYLTEHTPHWAPKTREIHNNSLAHLKPTFGKRLLTEITTSDVHYYQGKRQREGASGRTINIEIALLRLVLGKKRWIALENLKMLKERTDIGRELTEDESHRLLIACKASVSRSLYPAVVVSINTGLRNRELRLLRWRQVDLIEGEITVGKSKTEGGTGRVVPLSQTALAVLKEWRAAFPDALPEHAVWPRDEYGLMGKKETFGGRVGVYKTHPAEPVGSWSTAWRTAKKAAKVECRWHDLRHTFVSRIAAAGAMDATIMSLAGHLSRKMMEKYSHVRNAAKRQAVAVFDAAAMQ